jgi:cytochrome c-type biogenesis protein CcsB
MSYIQDALTNTAGISSILSFWVFAGSNALSARRHLLIKAGQWLLALGFIALTAVIVLRGLEAARFPISNLFESLLWFTWAIMGGYLYISFAYDVKQFGWLASLTAATFFMYSSFLPLGQHEIRPLAPALVSYWMQIHVPPLIVSYAMFFIGGLSAFVQLFRSGRLRSVFLALAALSTGLTAIALGTFTSTNSSLLQGLFVGGSLAGLGFAWWNLGKISDRQMNAARADLYEEVVYRSIMIGFPLLTIGIITGALWANHAWGTYWSWDPKESMSLATWLGYAIYIHLRLHHDCSAEKLSLVAIAGMLLTILTYLGFSSLGFGGLHSYGNFK